MEHLHGVVTLEQLEQAGITKDRLLSRPEYERIARGHYALPGSRRDFWFKAAAAQLIAGEDARLTSASALFPLGGVEQAPDRVQLVVPEGKGSRKRAGFDVRRSSHLPDAVILRSGIRLAPAAYALTDLARDARDATVAYTIGRALGLRLTDLRALERMAELRGQFPGSARLRRVLEEFEGGESHARRERSLRRALVRIGLPPHHGQVPILGRSGAIIRKADIAYPEVRLDVEVDGPHHFLPAQQAKDRSTDRELRTVRWDTLRYTVYEIDDDVDKAAAEVARVYHERERLLREAS